MPVEVLPNRNERKGDTNGTPTRTHPPAPVDRFRGRDPRRPRRHGGTVRPRDELSRKRAARRSDATSALPPVLRAGRRVPRGAKHLMAGSRPTAGAFLLAVAAVAAAVAAAPSLAPAAKTSCHAPSSRSSLAARKVAGRFVAWAVLRKNPVRARGLVTSRLAAGTTPADWRRGLIPVVPFVVHGRVQITFTLDISCGHRTAFDVGLRAVDAGEEAEVFSLEEVRRSGRWLVDSWGPPGIPPPPG